MQSPCWLVSIVNVVAVPKMILRIPILNGIQVASKGFLPDATLDLRLMAAHHLDDADTEYGIVHIRERQKRAADGAGDPCRLVATELEEDERGEANCAWIDRFQT